MKAVSWFAAASTGASFAASASVTTPTRRPVIPRSGWTNLPKDANGVVSGHAAGCPGVMVSDPVGAPGATKTR